MKLIKREPARQARTLPLLLSCKKPPRFCVAPLARRCQRSRFPMPSRPTQCLHPDAMRVRCLQHEHPLSLSTRAISTRSENGASNKADAHGGHCGSGGSLLPHCVVFYWPACTKKPFPTPSNPKKEAYVIMDLMCKVSTVYKKAPHLCLVYIHHVWLCA